MHNNTSQTLVKGCSSATQRAFLAADLAVFSAKPMTQRRAARLVGVSVPYLIAAAKVAKDPILKACVLAGVISLMDAAKQVSKPRATDLVQSMASASPTERAQVMRRFRDEALEVIDAETRPGNGKGNGHTDLFGDLAR